tara:strand:- start:155 stop:367 length:213 start_codon:yes stop_codon:yes gene_type:complete
MSLKVFYHNITQGTYNETCIVDLMDAYQEGDVLMKSEAGNALVHPVTKDEMKQLTEDWANANIDEIDWNE